MNYPENNKIGNNNKSFDIREFLKLCRHWWWLFVVTLLVFGFMGLYVLLSNVTKYDVQANIMIYSDSNEGGTISLARQFSIGNVLGGSGDVNNEFHVLQSHSVMRQTAVDLGLNISYTVKDGLKKIPCYPGTTPLELSADPAMGDTIRTTLLFKVNVNEVGKTEVKVVALKKQIAKFENLTLPAVINTPYGDFTLTTTPKFVAGKSLKEEIRFTSYDGAAESYLKKVNMSIPDRKSDMISISVGINDTKFGERLIDTIVANYNAKGVQAKQERDRKTAEFIDHRLLSLTDELSLSEEDIEKFQRDKNLIDLSAEAEIILTKLTTLEAQIETSETELSLLRQTRDFLRTPANKYNLLPLGQTTEATLGIASAYNDLIMQRMQLTTAAKSDNFALKNLEEKIDVTRGNMMLTLDKNIETGEFKLKELKALNKEYEGKLKQFPGEQRLYRAIERQQSVKEQLYLFLLQQREETALSIANAQPRAIIVDNAYTLMSAHKSSPKMILLTVLFFGFGLPVGFLLLKEKLRRSISSRKEVERLTLLPILGEISETKKAPLVVKSGDTSTVAEQFKLARANIQFILASKREKVIMVTSSSSGEGKTFVAINLAAALSIPNSKVLLIGADVRRPRIYSYLHLQPRFGLTEYLSSDELTPEDIIIHTPVDGTQMDIITAGPVPPNPSELLMSEKFDKLMDILRQRYDYIVIDSAPMGIVSDALNVVRIADATVYVCRINKTTIDEFSLINELAEDARLKKMSLIVNGVSLDKYRTYGYNSSDDDK